MIRQLRGETSGTRTRFAQVISISAEGMNLGEVRGETVKEDPRNTLFVVNADAKVTDGPDTASGDEARARSMSNPRYVSGHHCK